MPKSDKIVELHPDKDHNSRMDRDTYLYHAGRIREAEEAFDAVKEVHKKKIKKLRRSAKDVGMHLKTFDAMTKLLKAQGDETPDAAAARYGHYADMEGLQPRTAEQLDLDLADGRKKKKNRQYHTGYDHGIQGREPMAEDQSYLEGYADGAARKADLDERHKDGDDEQLDIIGKPEG